MRFFWSVYLRITPLTDIFLTAARTLKSLVRLYVLEFKGGKYKRKVENQGGAGVLSFEVLEVVFVYS